MQQLFIARDDGASATTAGVAHVQQAVGVEKLVQLHVCGVRKRSQLRGVSLGQGIEHFADSSATGLEQVFIPETDHGLDVEPLQ
ncbi:MAG TPA: hypothetical protein DCR55_15585 [Lentisphaeria bacterium]|nr:hypothetical protein [Lentisphaeria bacterium]